ncbi:TRAP transporter permease [Natronospirillum operosum]|nr:TRAP transporter fused permease subunit [Natronospirillum operosum]
MTQPSQTQDSSPQLPPPLATWFRWLLAGTITLIVIAWTGDLHRSILGQPFLVQEFSLVVLGLCISLVYLSRDIRGREYTGRPAYLNMLLATAGFAACAYAAYRYRILSEQMFYYPEEAFAISAIIVPLVIDGLRRMVGWPLVIIVLVFMAYGLFGDNAPAPFTARPWDLIDLGPHLTLDTTAMVGLPLTIGVTVVIPFIYFGALLNRAGGGEFFSDLAVAIMGGFRGGAAKIAIVASAFFGTISGSAVSNVASTGVISIPLMKRSGFSGRVAAATESVASTGGQFMPPVMGAAAFLMAELSQTPYQTIVVAAILPALFFFFAVFMQSDADSIRLKVKAIPKVERKPIGQVMWNGGHFLLPFVLLVVMLFTFNRSPQAAALWATGAVALLGLLRGYGGDRIRARDLFIAMQMAGRTSIEIILIVAAAGFVIGVLNGTGLVFGLTRIIVEMAGGNLVALLVMAGLISIVLGMGMPTVAVYVLLAALVVPALMAAGVPKLSAHMFVLYFGMMSMITPPIAIAAYAASSIADERPLGVAFTAMRYAWIAYLVPFIFVFRPEFLLNQAHFDATGLIEVVAAAVLLVLLMNGAFSGYLKGRLGPLNRLILLAAGGAVLIGITSQTYHWVAYAAGVLAFALIAQRHWLVPRSAEA